MRASRSGSSDSRLRFRGEIARENVNFALAPIASGDWKREVISLRTMDTVMTTLDERKRRRLSPDDNRSDRAPADGAVNKSR